MPKTLERNAREFESFLDKQSGEDSGFFIRQNGLWTKFVDHQVERFRTLDKGDRTKFIMAECTGLQDQAVDWNKGRETERYVFNHHCMLDHRGMKLSPVDCVFFPQLSAKKDAVPILKGIKYVKKIFLISSILSML